MNKRESNFELMRIICMFLIVTFHAVFHSGVRLENGITTYNKIITDIIYYFGEIGVNCFILLSGYFFNKTKFKWSKVISMLLQVLFYIVLCRYITGIIVKHLSEYTRLEGFLFPLTKGIYWFVAVYILLYIISPYIKKLINTLSKKEFQNLIISQLIIWCVYPTLISNYLKLETTEDIAYYNRYIWMIIVYFIGAYISVYGLDFLNTLKKSITFELLVFSILLLYIILIDTNIIDIGIDANYFITPNTVIELLLGFGLFNIFKNIRIKENNIINYISSCVLGIYMFHDGDMVRVLWKCSFPIASYQNSNKLLFYIIMATITVMMDGIIIESARKVIWKLMKSIINRLNYHYKFCILRNIGILNIRR